MINRGILFWVMAAICTGIGLFMVKYKVQELEDRIDGINRRIVENQRATHVLKVEYAHLGEMRRIEALNEKYLQLQPITLRQIGRIDQVPMRRDDGAFVTDNKTIPTRGPGTGAPSSTDAPSASATLRPAAKPEAGARAPASGTSRPSASVSRDAVVSEPVTTAPAEEPDAAVAAPAASPPPAPRTPRNAPGGAR
jgi:cell division protein FtsL